MTTSTLLTPASVTATGGGLDLDISRYTGPVAAVITSLNTAGTSPTLANKIQSSDALAVGHSQMTVGTVDNELREGATTNVRIAAKFTQSGARSIKQAWLRLKKGGTIAAGKKLTLKIETDSSGPSGTVLGTSSTVDIDTEVSTSYTWTKFTFAKPVDVADATAYHFALEGDYTADGTNNVMWRSATVASGGNFFSHNNTSWSATATKNLEVFAEEYAFADVAGLTFTGMSGASSTLVESKVFQADPQKAVIRLYSTIGGTSNPAFTTSAAVVGQLAYQS